MPTADTTSPLTKLTVNLLPASREALDKAAVGEGDSRTDTVNRALQVYAALAAEQRDGWVIQLRKPFPGLLGWLGLGRVSEFRILHQRDSQ